MATKNQHGADAIKEPYVGPLPFEEKDEDIFFGREQETSELISLIVAHPLLLLYSQSGAGKTSLLKASLLPLLKKRKIEVLPPARVRGQGAQSDVILEGTNVYLFNALEYLSGNSLSPKQRARMSLTDFLPPRRPANKREVLPLRVVIFDQFEEIFTFDPERFEERQNFFEQIRDALEADTLLRIIFAMREDFIAELDPYASILPERLQTRYRLMRLNEHAARAAVEKPLERANQLQSVQYMFEPDAADKVVDNLRTIYVMTPKGEKTLLGPFIEPVHLQVVCQTLWRKLEERRSRNVEAEEIRITGDDVKELGDVNAALSEFYEKSLHAALETVRTTTKKTARSPKLTEGVLRAWFGRTLITPAGTRGIVFGGRRDETVGGIPRAAITELEKQRLIRAELRGSEMWYELSHDRLIQPIRESNERWLRKQPVAQQIGQDLEEKAAEWTRMNKGRSLLLDQAGLREAEKWLESSEAAGIGYSDTLYAFIQASQAAQQQRRVRQLIGGSVVLAVLFIMMFGVSAYAWQQESRAEAARAEANVAKDEADKLRGLAEEQKQVAQDFAKAAQFEAEEATKARSHAEDQEKIAVAARLDADKQRLLALDLAGSEKTARIKAETAEADAQKQKNAALSNSFAARSELLREEQPNLLEPSVVLALEAMRRNPSLEGEQALRHGLAILPQPVNEIDFNSTDIAFTPDGHLTAISDKETRRYDVNGNAKGSPLKVDSGVRRHVLSQNGVYAAATTEDSLDGRNDSANRTVITNTTNPNERTVIRYSNDPDSISYRRLLNTGFSPDGKYFAGMPGEDFLRVWETKSGRLVMHLSVSREPGIASDDWIASYTFSPEGNFIAVRRVASASVYRIADGSRIFTTPLAVKDVPRPLPWRTQEVALSADGKYLATTLGDLVQIWDVRGQSEVTHWRQQSRVERVIFSRDAKFVATVNTNTATIWDPKTGREITRVAHVVPITKVGFSPLGNFLVTSSEDRTARLWDVQSGREISRIGRNSAVHSFSFTPDEKYLAVASNDISLWDMTKDGISVVLNQKQRVPAIVFSGDGQYMATLLGHSGDEVTRNLEARRESLPVSINIRRMSDGHVASLTDLDFLNAVIFSPDGKSLLTAGPENSVIAWDVDSGKRGKTLVKFDGEPFDFSFFLSPDGKYVGAVKHRGILTIADLSTGQKYDLPYIATELGHLEPYIDLIDFSPDGTKMITRYNTNPNANFYYEYVSIWDLKSRKPIKHLEESRLKDFFKDRKSSIEFSPYGKYFGISDRDTCDIYDSSTGEFVRQIETGIGSQVLAFTFSGDEKTIAITSGGEDDDNTSGTQIEFFDITGGDGQITFHLQPQGNNSFAVFSPDRRYIASGGTTGLVQLWEVSSRREVARIKHNDFVGAVAFSPDGKYIATGSDDSTARLTLLKPADLMTLACSLLSRNLTKEEWVLYFGEEPYHKTCPQLR